MRQRYDTPRTPYERALASGTLDEATIAGLRDLAEALNPAALRRGIDAALRAP
ncbi:MAG TPA: hypothetical protein VNM43_11345 [Dehalococcoidia bacterium]|nr:hypothetical protein [Dehalococcoidia bacterium]